MGNRSAFSVEARSLVYWFWTKPNGNGKQADGWRVGTSSCKKTSSLPFFREEMGVRTSLSSAVPKGEISCILLEGEAPAEP
jgi:hypothetical protein